jgi:SAM-dependent methyltransferase
MKTTRNKSNYTAIFKQTKKDYNTIAHHFSQKRSHMWQELKPYLNYVKKKDKILDAGCGNARLLSALEEKNKLTKEDINYLGIDFSKELIKIARKKHPKVEFKITDLNKNKTFKNLKNFDIVFCLATLHHFPTKTLQQKLIRNLKKTLKKEGILVISVWNLWQKQYIKIHLKQLKLKIRNKNLKWFKVPYKIPKSNKAVIKANRFCYSFTKKDLENLIKKENLNIIKQTQGKNLCLAVKK